MADSTLQNMTVDLSTMDEASRREVLEKAFDFRGDCTLTLADGREVTGYVFDRRVGGTFAASVARLMIDGVEKPVSLTYGEISKIGFGRDAAHGKTWEAWVKRYTESRQAGKAAGIASEVL